MCDILFFAGLLNDLNTYELLNKENFYIKHTPYILEKVLSNIKMWSVHSPERFVFEAILTHTGLFCLISDLILEYFN